MKNNILKINHLYVTYSAAGKQTDYVLKDLSINIFENEFLGLVGESGSGKSTLANTIAGFIEPLEGEIFFRDKALQNLSFKDKIATTNAGIQMVFQDPYNSLDPIITIGEQLEEPLIIQDELNKQNRKIKVLEMLDNIGLVEEYANRYPRQLSGGQLQRVAIGSALITEPDLLLADEPVSSLDVSVQAQILDLLQELRIKLGFACLFVSHDLSVVQFLCDRIAVLNQGEIVEIGEVTEIFANPQNECTQQLIQDSEFLIV